MHEPHKWTSDDVTRLTQLFNEGRKLVDIGVILGLSEGSICGKVKRLKLKRPEGWKNPPRTFRTAGDVALRGKRIVDLLPATHAESLRADFMEQDHKFFDQMIYGLDCCGETLGMKLVDGKFVPCLFEVDKTPGTKNPRWHIPGGSIYSGCGSSAALAAEWGAR